MNRLVSFFIVMAILGLIIGLLNKGLRAIGFFVALLSFVLLIGIPGSGGSNFFSNLFNRDQDTTPEQAEQGTPAQGFNAQGQSTQNKNGQVNTGDRNLPASPTASPRNPTTSSTTRSNRSTTTTGGSSSGRRALW